MGQIQFIMQEYVDKVHFPKIGAPDIIEVLIISFLVYQIMLWIRNTKAWSLLKGVVIVLAFYLLAVAFNMTTIKWILKNVTYIGLVGIIVLFQPELRRALEELGKKKFFVDVFRNDDENGRFSDGTIKEITTAAFEMGKVRTGALIVVRQDDNLSEFERTGIKVDGVVSSQLLINIFEHNTPLHDGAVIISGDRIASATCYLPLSENMMISKELGTRHRAGVGMSEETDALVIVVSEETGKISVAYRGNLERNLTKEELESRLADIQNRVEEEKIKKPWKGKGLKNGKKADE